jgi:hypothetical protein
MCNCFNSKNIRLTVNYLMEKHTTIAKHVPTGKVVCCINYYVISVII